MENENSYRHLFKWGDKREETVGHHMAEVIKEKFGLTEDDFGRKHLPGTGTVRLDKPSLLKPAQVEFFNSICGSENVLTDDLSRARYSCGKFYGELLNLRLGLVPEPPDAVVAPRTSEEVVQIVEFCSAERIAVVPAGGLSSVTGAVRAPRGGIALDLTKHLNRVLAVNKINKTVTVQAGIYGPALEEELNSQGYSCGHFPQSFEYSTVGGWISARGAGQASTGYGKIEDMLVSLKAVTPAGIIETKDYPRT
ncbi:FAD-binding oxidoreductase, partial [bacterium]|nr:FAD-binding oxidoreductase [bacterium]